MGDWESKGHSKYLLQYHVIFVCKYRKKLLTPRISEDIKKLSAEICTKHQVQIPYMETDKDHIHYMIETSPNINLADLIKTMKRAIPATISGSSINPICRSASGVNTPFGQTGIFFVLLGASVKKD